MSNAVELYQAAAEVKSMLFEIMTKAALSNIDEISPRELHYFQAMEKLEEEEMRRPLLMAHLANFGVHIPLGPRYASPDPAEG